MGNLYGGSLLRIDLSSGEIKKTPTLRYSDLWLGGRGFNTRILYEDTNKDTDPLGPDNVILFSLGPFTGTMVPGSGRVEIAAKSPVTGVQGMSNRGGALGAGVKICRI